ncbi:MAG: hypothetical protein ABSB76_30420 [Streptosporangiaceae bacterium]
MDTALAPDTLKEHPELVERIVRNQLIMYGGADAVVDPRNSKILSGRISNLQVVVFPGSAICSSGKSRPNSQKPLRPSCWRRARIPSAATNADFMREMSAVYFQTVREQLK